MRLAYTSDIHLDASDKNREAARAIASVVREHHSDVFILAGDAGNTLDALGETLSCFESVEAVRLFVPGNHDVWIETQGSDLVDSRAKFAEWIPAVCRTNGFQDLGREPVVIGDVGFVGSLGWYDYTFADPRLGLGEDVYWRGRYGNEIWWDKKMTYWVPALAAPESHAARTPISRGASRDRVRPSIARATSRRRMRDREICAEMVERLETHVAAIEDRAETIVAVVHTLPFFVGIPRSEPPAYVDAFTGSEHLGRVLEGHPKVRHCIHGHKHTSGDWIAGGIHMCRRILGRLEDNDDMGSHAARAVGVIDL